MSNTIKLKRGTSTPSVSDISNGEVAIDTQNKKLYINDSGTVKEIGGSGTIAGASGLDFNDNVKVRFGTGNDLEIYHNGSSSYIDEVGTGSLKIQTNGTGVDIQKGSSETIARFIADGAVELYYDDSKKLETSASGIKWYDDLNCDDLDKIRFGNSQDLQIYHDGTDSRIHNSTGRLVTRSATESSWYNAAGNEVQAKFIIDGAVELYYDNSKKAETYSNGFKINGQLQCEGDVKFDNPDNAGRDVRWDSSDDTLEFSDNTKAGFGNDLDLQIFHDGSNSYLTNTTGNLIIKDTTDAVYIQAPSIRFQDDTTNEDIAKFISDGAVELYYDNAKKFHTISSGTVTTGHHYLLDSDKLKLGDSEDFQIYHSDTLGNVIGAVGGHTTKFYGPQVEMYSLDGTKKSFVSDADGAIELYFNNVKRFETTAAGTLVTDALVIPDGGASNNRLSVGTGDDMRIYHTGNHSYIRNYTGDLYIQGNNSGTVTNNVICQSDGSTELHYDGTKQIHTTSTGVTLGDDKRVDFGDGADLKIYHDGGNSWVKDAGTGALYLDGSAIKITHGGATETLAAFYENGAAELWYNGVKKFETNADGTLTQGTIQVNGAEGGTAQIRIHADEGDDNADKWRFVANTDGTFGLQNLASGSYEDSIKATGNGAVEIYHDNSKKFNTLSDGIHVHGRIQLNDDGKLKVGDSGDLEIYHDGSDSYINNTTGDMWYRTYGPMYFLNSWDSEYYAKFKPNNTVELYYDGSKKFETFSGGVSVTGSVNADQLHLGDSDKALFGDSNDLQIYHNGTNSFVYNATGGLYLKSTNNAYIQVADGEEALRATANGAVELKYDNNTKLETTSNGVTVTSLASTGNIILGDGIKSIWGDGEDLQIFHDTSDSYIKDSGTGKLRLLTDSFRVSNAADSENLIAGEENGSVDLFYDDSKKLETKSYGLSLHGNVLMTNTDNQQLKLGAGNDLVIYHQGSDSYIDNNNGQLYLRNNVDDWGANHIFIEAKSGESSAKFLGDGAVELYYDDVKKFETTSIGATVTGSLNVTNDFTLSGANANLTWDKSADTLEFMDNGKAAFGNSDDLQIYHDGSHSYIKDSGTGDLVLQASTARIINAAATENIARFFENGACELYYNNSKKLETDSFGVSIQGDCLKVPDGSAASPGFTFNNEGSADTGIYRPGANLLGFATGGTERMNIDTSGVDVRGVLTTSGTHNYLKGSSTTTSTLTLKKSDSGADSIDYLQCRSNSNGLYLTIEGDGDVKNYNNSYGSTSDSKLKENIVDANSQWEDIKAVKVRNFNFKASTGMPTDKHIGVIAQEIETVSAGLVSESIDRNPDTGEDLGTKTKTVKYSILYMKSIKALQEAMAKIETLETKVAALESA